MVFFLPTVVYCLIKRERSEDVSKKQNSHSSPLKKASTFLNVCPIQITDYFEILPKLLIHLLDSVIVLTVLYY